MDCFIIFIFIICCSAVEYNLYKALYSLVDGEDNDVVIKIISGFNTVIITILSVCLAIK